MEHPVYGMVPPAGIEPAFSGSKPDVLSIKLQRHDGEESSIKKIRGQ